MPSIFEPCSLGPLTLKNRIIRSATHEGMANADGTPTDALFKNYENLAIGNAGAIITGYVSVMQSGKTFPNMRMFDTDAYIDVYRPINEKLKPYGTPVILQIAHGGYGANAKVTGQQVIGPSARRRNDYGDPCKEASEAEIEGIINAFVRAVVRAKAAGFDAVQLHAAHGYLLSQFISPKYNKRKDKWGGTLENRMRIVMEILRRARKEVGTYPIFAKMSARDHSGKGLALQEGIQVARMLQDAGCDAIEVSCGYGDFMDTIRLPKPPIDAVLAFMPQYRSLSAFKKRLFRLMAPFIARPRTPLHNYNVDAAEAIKQNMSIPVIVVGGIRTLQDIADIVTEKKIDFVSLSRPFIIEPDIVNRFQKGQTASRCIECGYCLIASTSRPLRCYYGRVPKELEAQK